MEKALIIDEPAIINLTSKIENNNIKQITSNMADANVFNYEYDYIIKNNGSLEDFKKETFNFARKIKGFRG